MAARHKHRWVKARLGVLQGGDVLYEMCSVCHQTRKPKKRSKFGNKKTSRDGHVFDSIAEANYYTYLKQRLDAGDIANLDLQPTYILQDGFMGNDGKIRKDITYTPDFRFIENGELVVVDVKGEKTEAFGVRKKLFEYIYGIDLVVEDANNWR